MPSQPNNSSGSASESMQWRFLVDENLPRSLTSELNTLGHVAEHVHDINLSGAKDPAVYAYAQTHHLTIITGDKDFSDMRAYAPPHAGIVVVEVADTMPPDARKRIILRQLATLSGQSLADTLIILEPGRIRLRR